MANPEHVEFIKSDNPAKYIEAHPREFVRFDLRGAAFDGLDLSGVKLGHAFLDGATFRGSDLHNVDLHGAQCIATDFAGSKLNHTSFHGADCRHASFDSADMAVVELGAGAFGAASFRGARLNWVRAVEVDFTSADFTDSKLLINSFSRSRFARAVFAGASIQSTDFVEATFDSTDFGDTTLCNVRFAECDLSNAVGLDRAKVHGRVSLGYETLLSSNGRIPESFLKQTGMPQWMVAVNKICNPTLTGSQIENCLIEELFMSRTDSPLFLGGAFISHSSVDEKFCTKLYRRLEQKGMSVTMDVHDFVAGGLESQVFKAIRRNDVVILVLSESSLKSDWVWAEIRATREREKNEGRMILCPIRLDDAWKTCDHHKVEMGYIGDRLVVDFSDARPKQFNQAFDKLIKGIKTEFGPRD